MNKDNQTSGLPLRGLAMVLIAVALLLGLWGLYALTQDNDTDTSTAADSNATATAPAEADGDDTIPDGTREPDADEPPASGPEDEEEADRRDDADADAPEVPRDGTDGADAADDRDGATARIAAPGAGAGEAAPAPRRLNVLNNSTVPNLAAEVSETLNEQGYRLGEVGNLPDDVEVLPENTVFFQPDNADAEERARKLADRVDGVAREYIPSLPEGTDGDNDITLVLIGQVEL